MRKLEFPLLHATQSSIALAERAWTPPVTGGILEVALDDVNDLLHAHHQLYWPPRSSGDYAAFAQRHT